MAILLGGIKCEFKTGFSKTVSENAETALLICHLYSPVAAVWLFSMLLV